MPIGELPLDHLLRRAGFGTTAAESAAHSGLSLAAATDLLLAPERVADDTDTHIGQEGYAAVTPRGTTGLFSPNTVIDDARQRWLFRLVHGQRPLQEKMALFWHQHFATAYGKLAGAVGTIQATKMLALKAGELPGPQGQLELFRARGLGRFRDLLVAVAQDPAMLVWLDGRSNTRTRPQENFGREVMELFTLGRGNYREQDVYAAARVFTGWNLRLSAGGNNQDPDSYYEFFYNAGQHELTSKTFTFAVYADGGHTIPARSAADGYQDGLDFLAALAAHPETGRRLARRLWTFFVSEVDPAPPGFVEAALEVYLRSDTDMTAVLGWLFRSPWFLDLRVAFSRYAWPAEFVARAIREIGWTGFSLDTARSAMINMGQTLFEPPDVGGWETGPAWITSGGLLARMNFASTLAASQRAGIARMVPATAARSADAVVAAILERLSPMTLDPDPRDALVAYLSSQGPWTGSDAQLTTRVAGLVRLILASGEYQFI